MSRDCVVLIPYFEGGAKLTKSLRSIEDWHNRIAVYVVDDGSIDLPANAVVESEAWPIPVTVHTLPGNVGVAHALNAGISALGYDIKYVARLDCGDICRPERFVKQLEYMDSHQDIALVGSAVRFFRPQGGAYTLVSPLAAAQIHKRMRINCPFIHPSIVIRREVFGAIGVYSAEYPHAEDYDLFWRIAERFPVANLGDVLLDVLLDPAGVSAVYRRKQIQSRIRIMASHFDYSALAAWGIIRGCLQLMTGRQTTIWMRRFIELLHEGPSPGSS